MLDVINDMIAQFDSDPPDTDFQQGYLEALRELRRVALEFKRAASEAAIVASTKEED